MDDSALPFRLAPHDLHVRLGDEYYYVRAVRRGTSSKGGGYGGGSGGGSGDVGDVVVALVAIVLLVLLALLFGRRIERAFERWQRRQPWKVVVLRATGDAWGPTGRLRTVHRETVVSAEAPRARLAELADEVRAGRFAGRVERRVWSRRRA
ncbi:hypothetical protein GCM10027596_14140 [Nocardioides korecus]